MSRSIQVGVDLGLSEAEKTELLQIARSVIEARAKNLKLPEVEVTSEKLKEPRGAFVSLHKKGMLRGCIGATQTKAPLYKTIQEMASAAAFRDPRFSPVKAEELPYLDLEISVLTPIEKITDPNQIQIGLHGLIIRQGGQSGLLLPQVALDRNWSTIVFLEETCRKAGLPKDAWKSADAEIYAFSADVFS